MANENINNKPLSEDEKARIQEERNAKNAKKREIKSELELISIFLKESVGLYTKAKCNEHIKPQFPGEEVPTFKETRIDVKEDLNNLLDGLKEDFNKKSILFKVLHEELDNYISKMDKVLTKERDSILAKERNKNPNTLAFDNALIKAAENSVFTKMAKAIDNYMEKKNVKDIEQIFESSTKYKIFNSLGNMCKKIGLNKLSSYFQQKNSKVSKTKSFIQQITRERKDLSKSIKNLR
jgi:hypothetical protein